jgi:cation-transporting ATPase F
MGVVVSLAAGDKVPAALLWRTALVGALMLLGSFGLFELVQAQRRSLAEARTFAANAFVMVEIFYLFNCRSLTHPT